MPVIYPEGGMPGLTLRQKQQRQAVLPIDTFKVQLVPLRPAPKAKINSPGDVAKLVSEMGDYDREVAKLIHLDTKNQVMGVETISIGSLSSSIVHPRETVKGAILNNSANVVFVHNHPSGICEASSEDVMITGKLKEAFETVGIALLDSMIVGKGCYFSMRESGFVGGKTGSFGTVTENEPARPTTSCVREPVNQQTKEKVEFIHAVTDYITAPNLEKRNRAAGRLRASGYFRDWYGTFFYEHDRKRAKRNLMKFLGANEQGLGLVDYTYYGVISEYLYVISKPEPMPAGRVSEGTTKRQVEGTGAEFRIGEHVVKDLENDQFLLKHLLEGGGTPEIAQMIKRVMDFAAEHKAVDFRQNVAAKINECLGVRGVPMFRTRYVTPYPPGIVLMVCYGSRGRMRGVWFRDAPDEDMRILASRTDGYRHMLSKYAQYMPVPAGAVSIGGAARFTGQAMVSEARSGAEVEIKYEPGKIFPYRVVYAGTDRTVQTREYPEAMAYYTQTEAERAVSEEGYTLVKKGRPPYTVYENIQNINNIEAFLNRLTVDTSRYSRAVPIPDSLVIGAAIPGDGFLFAYHVTDDPEGTVRKLRSNIPLCQMNPEGDLGCGLYVSGVPEYWRGRSTNKWEFARNLSRAQRQRLVDVILSDPNYRKGGGYLADFEVDYLNRDMKQFIETGDVNVLAMTGNQPYNVHITKETAGRAGVPVPKEPGLIKVKFHGKFINAADLYSKTEIIQKAAAWVRKSKPKLFGEYTSFEINKSGVNAWLASMGYSGAFTKSGFSTNPEMVIWDRKAIIDAWIPEPQT